jgi:hypothetical protein
LKPETKQKSNGALEENTMAMDPNGPANTLQPPQPDKPKSSTLPMLVGLGTALAAVFAITIWAITRPSVIIDYDPVTPVPTGTAIVQAVNTPTPFTGAATFTPIASSVISGPHVLGITAGVGMSKGDIAGPAQIAVLFSEAMDEASTQSAFSLLPAVQGDFKWQGNTLFFTPASSLKPATDYTVSVAADAKTKVALYSPRPCRPASRPPPHPRSSAPSPQRALPTSPPT